MKKQEKRDILAELAVLLIDDYQDPTHPEDGYKLSLVFKLLDDIDRQEAIEYLLRKKG